MHSAAPALGATVMTLGEAPVGAPLSFVSVDSNPPLCRRLRALGFRRGAPLTVVQRSAGGGRVVSVAGSRIALGRSILAQALVEAA